MNLCPYCGFGYEGTRLCPGCGRFSNDQNPIPYESFALVKRFFFNLRELLLHPTRFFRRIPSTGGLSGAIAFGLTCHWIGVSVRHLTELSSGDLTWQWSNGIIILDPFKTLAGLIVLTTVIYIGAKLLINPKRSLAVLPVRFSTVLRVLSLSLAPYVLLAIPLFSPALCHIWGFVISVKGFREVFEISGRRAIFVTLFPMVLFFGTMLVGLLALGVALINMISLIL